VKAFWDFLASLFKKRKRVLRIDWAKYPWNNPTIPRLVLRVDGFIPVPLANHYLNVSGYDLIEFTGKTVCAEPVVYDGADDGSVVWHYIRVIDPSDGKTKPYTDHYGYVLPRDALWSELLVKSTIPGIAADGIDENGDAFPQVSLQSTVLVCCGLTKKEVRNIEADHAPSNVLHYLDCFDCTFRVSGKDSGRVRTTVDLGAVRSERSGGNRVICNGLESRGVVFRADKSVGIDSVEGTCVGGSLLRDIGLVDTYGGGRVRVKRNFTAYRGKGMDGPLFVAGAYFDAESGPCVIESGAEFMGDLDFGVAVFGSEGHRIGLFETHAPQDVEFVSTTEQGTTVLDPRLTTETL
jgi:hypothetical protein